MITWPQMLVTEVARRRCILFLGAGVASSAKTEAGLRPLAWKDFLAEAAELVPRVHKPEIKSLIDSNKLLLALQAIRDQADAGDYRALLDKSFNNAAFIPSDLHNIIFSLDSRLVITTNFDKIYEKHCLTASTEGFKVIPYYSSSLGDEIRSDTRLIIKAHGSIDDISKMVFTKAEYHAAKENHSSFYTILKALLLTNTCIFIGCGMDDPDVLLLLEEVRITANPQRPHYALLKEGSHSSFVKSDLASAYNIKVLEYGPNHSDLISDLEALLDLVEGKRAIS
ncbi:SIR2 family protein [Pseudomonas sp. S1Bt30]|uniref:SIR2 family protein n=1 Tax=Pseudomonas quebecensis TaxID=2995174 RepID=A0ABY6QGD6_9PSED|nr:SIR2 family protein [Pseudomonas quebecensis]MCX4065140.1 SIR2 family protein [Pseudomonas quebecensis]UZW19027.1 SIR2 family protein [Pseudomonas quebecensis]UZW23558.1 SIR2 family protein [Pseudomonas quebecensis]UZW28620.1 SIR2 family protein [Pseudomonas quebecensis]